MKLKPLLPFPALLALLSAPFCFGAEVSSLEAEFRALAASNPACSTLHKDVGFEGRPGMGAGVDRYSKLLETKDIVK